MAEQLCTFWLNEIYFGIDVQHVQEVIRPQVMTRIPLAPPDICGLINLRGEIITVIDLQQRLGIGEFSKRSQNLQPESQGFNIVVSYHNEVVSLLVDDVADVLEFAENTLQTPPATLQGKMRHILAGAYPLTAGFLLAIDIEKLLNVQVI